MLHVSALKMNVHLPKEGCFAPEKDIALCELKMEPIDKEKILKSFFEHHSYEHSRSLITKDKETVIAKLSVKKFAKFGITGKCFKNFANEFKKSSEENFEKLDNDTRESCGLEPGNYIIYKMDSIPLELKSMANPVVIGSTMIGFITSGLKFDQYIFEIKDLPKKTAEIWTLPEELEF